MGTTFIIRIKNDYDVTIKKICFGFIVYILKCSGKKYAETLAILWKLKLIGPVFLFHLLW